MPLLFEYESLWKLYNFKLESSFLSYGVGGGGEGGLQTAFPIASEANTAGKVVVVLQREQTEPRPHVPQLHLHSNNYC